METQDRDMAVSSSSDAVRVDSGDSVPMLNLADIALTAHVMPIHDMRAGTLWGYEVLVRGLHRGDLVRPDDLMDLARREGSLMNFDRRCIEATSRTASHMSRDQLVFLNVYAQTLLDEQGFEHVMAHVRPLVQAGHRIGLEIHESMTYGQIEQLQPVFLKLRESGVLIALDDLMPKDLTVRHLRIRPDYIKVDRSVFMKMTPVDAARTINTLARCQESLGYQLIVEGIEDSKMLSIVTFAGAWLVQGYFFGRPVPLAPPPA